MFRRKYKLTENFQDRIARLYGMSDNMSTSDEDVRVHFKLLTDVILRVRTAIRLIRKLIACHSILLRSISI